MIELSNQTKPSRPGWYWARWVKATWGTFDGKELTPSDEFGIVQVWSTDNKARPFGVFVPGVREPQWLECFEWGEPCPEPSLSNGLPAWVEDAAKECAQNVLVGSGFVTFAEIIERHYQRAK